MRREGCAFFLVFVLAFLALGYAWLTRHPDAAIVERASEWPVVGPLAERFRASYLPPAEEGAAETETVGREIRIERREVPSEADDAVDTYSAKPFVWVAQGDLLKSEPRPDAPLVTEFTQPLRLTLVERRGDWFEVRYRDEPGWVYLEGYSETGRPPLGSAPGETKALPPRPPDAELLASARAHFSGEEVVDRLGPYALYTDVADAELLRFLSAVAAQAESLYAARYGVEPLGEPAGAVVLFAGEADYRRFQRAQEKIAVLPASGHVGQGLVALYRGARPAPALGGTLLHELAHLINRRAIGPALPPWLDEGIADDLGGLGIEGNTVHSDRLGGEVETTATRVRRSGALASLAILERRLGTAALAPVDELLALDWEAFVLTGDRSLHYAESAFLVRYLVDDPELAARFAGFLSAVADGGSVEPPAFYAALGTTASALEADYLAWLTRLIEETAGDA